MLDHTIPGDVRLSLYLSTRFLQELSIALQLIGIPSAYVRPGIAEAPFPRLYAGFTEDELEALEEMNEAAVEVEDFVCAVPFVLNEGSRCRTDSDPQWWFIWWADQTLPICPATDMNEAARIIAEQLFEQPG
jgi:hypothetical protein